jgi:histidinol-phosphate aminotransferase
MMAIKSFDIEKWVRPNVWRMKPYSSARDDFQGSASVYLDANENPLARPYNRYPDPHQRKLKEKLSELKSVTPEQIFLGNGSDEAIDLIIRAFCEPGKDNVVIPQPTYGMYTVSAETNNVQIKTPALTPDFHLDTDAVFRSIDDHTKIIFLCSPNNPSGNLLKRDDIEKVLNHFEGLVVVDEAYIDFAGEPSLCQWLDRYHHLIILQTLSKAWGLAALRLGLCFSTVDIISIINKIKPPYNVNEVTQQLVWEALQNADGTKQWVQQIIEQRQRLVDELTRIDFVEKIFPSDANFLLVKVKQPQSIYNHLMTRGIIVRDRSKVKHGEGCLRITVGTAEENTILIEALISYAKSIVH